MAVAGLGGGGVVEGRGAGLIAACGGAAIRAKGPLRINSPFSLVTRTASSGQSPRRLVMTTPFGMVHSSWACAVLARVAQMASSCVQRFAVDGLNLVLNCQSPAGFFELQHDTIAMLRLLLCQRCWFGVRQSGHAQIPRQLRVSRMAGCCIPAQ